MAYTLFSPILSTLALLTFLNVSYIYCQQPSPFFKGENIVHSTPQLLIVHPDKTKGEQNKAYMDQAFLLKNAFQNYDIFDFPLLELAQFVSFQQARTDSIKFVMELGDSYIWAITLVEESLISTSYERRFIDQPISSTDHPKHIAFKGYVNNNTANRVRLTLKDDFLEGFIMCDGKRIFIEKAIHLLEHSSDTHLMVYDEQDYSEESPLNCYAKGLVTHKPHVIQQNVSTQACNNGVLELEIATAATYSLFNKLGNDPLAVEAHILAILNGVQLDYERFNLSFKLVELVIFEEPNNGPFANDENIEIVFQEFSSWAPTGFQNEHDIGICFYNGPGAGTIGKAWLGTVCRSRSYCVVDRLSSLAANRALVSHEMGHNFSAQHVSGTNIMRASLMVTDVWAASSINAIQNHIDTRTCLACKELTPSIPIDTLPPPEPTIELQVKILLEGFYQAENELLTSRAVQRGILPVKQPFHGEPFNYQGKETTNLNDSNVVDWVFVEIRDEDNPLEIISQKAGLLKPAGFIVNADSLNINPLSFPDVVDGTYKIAVYHRNHLAILSKGSVSLKKGEIANYDFTVLGNSAFGTEQLKKVGESYTMFGGDFDQNGIINNLDFNLWRNNAAAIDTYISADADGNGIINNLDFNIWKNNRSKIGVDVLRK